MKSNEASQKSRSPWSWLYKILIRPRDVFEEMAENEGSVWIKPLLVLSILVIVLALLSGPVRAVEAQMNMAQPPDDFQYWSEEQQNQFFESQNALQGQLFVTILPLVSGLIGVWIGWFLLGSILHLLMTFGGSRQPQSTYLNLVAWSAIPLGLRTLVQIVAVLVSKQLVGSPGLSGFVDASAGGFLNFVRAILSMVDIYAVGFVLILLIGAPILSNLKSAKARAMTGLAIAIYVILAALPTLIISRLSGLGTIRPFLFF